MAITDNQICIVCKNPVTIADYRMIALEKPYINLFVHNQCKQHVTLDVIKNFLVEMSDGTRNQRKRN